MADTSLLSGGRAPGNATTYNPTAGADFPPGTPVRPGTTDGTVLAARANSQAAATPTGIATGTGVEGNGVLVQYAGPVKLTTEEWDAVTGQTGGLTRGVLYFLSAATAGHYSTSPPGGEGNFTVIMGVALSSTEMLIQFNLTNQPS